MESTCARISSRANAAKHHAEKVQAVGPVWWLGAQPPVYRRWDLQRTPGRRRYDVITTLDEPEHAASPRYRPDVGEPQHESDRALVRRAQAGSTVAFGELYRRYWPLAYRTVVVIVQDAALAEDIAQEVFMAAIRSLDRFDRRRPFAPWLARIAANRAIDATRARSRRAEASLGGVEIAHLDPESDGAIVRMIGRLPEDQRAVVALRYVADLTPGEIADALDLPRGTVNSRLRRGLDGLAGMIREVEQ